MHTGSRKKPTKHDYVVCARTAGVRVPACIRMVLSAFEQSLTERQVRQILGQPRFGINLVQAFEQLARSGMSVSYHHDWSLLDLRDCLRDGRYPIVGVERQFFGHRDSSHAIVLLEIGSQFVSAFDPLDTAQPETFLTETFEQAWHGAGHQALVIQSSFP